MSCINVGDICIVLPCPAGTDDTFGILDNEEVLVIGQEQNWPTPHGPIFGFVVRHQSCTIVVARPFLVPKRRAEDVNPCKANLSLSSVV